MQHNHRGAQEQSPTYFVTIVMLFTAAFHFGCYMMSPASRGSEDFEVFLKPNPFECAV